MKLWRILCAALFCACVNLPGQIAGLPEHNCLCESFISHKDIDRLKNDPECMGYFGDVGAPGTPSYVAVCTRGSKNYFIKFIDFDYAAKKLKTASEAPVSQKTAEVLLDLLKEEIFNRKIAGRTGFDGVCFEFGARVGDFFVCAGAWSPPRGCVVRFMGDIARAKTAEKISEILEKIKAIRADLKLTLKLEDASAEDVANALSGIYARGVCFEQARRKECDKITVRQRREELSKKKNLSERERILLAEIKNYKSEDAAIGWREERRNINFENMSAQELIGRLSKEYSQYDFKIDGDGWIIILPKESMLKVKVPAMELSEKTVSEIMSLLPKSLNIVLYEALNISVNNSEKNWWPYKLKVRHIKTPELPLCEFLTFLCKSAGKKISWKAHAFNNGSIGVMFIW